MPSTLGQHLQHASGKSETREEEDADDALVRELESRYNYGSNFAEEEDDVIDKEQLEAYAANDNSLSVLPQSAVAAAEGLSSTSYQHDAGLDDFGFDDELV